MKDMMGLPVNTYGLCAGRHPIPVEEYIFDGEIDPMDFESMDKAAKEWFRRKRREKALPCGVRDNGGRYVTPPINLAVTGLTAALMAFLNSAMDYGISVVLWHFDREVGVYKPQEIRVPPFVDPDYVG